MNTKLVLSLGLAALVGLGAALPATAGTTAKPATAATTTAAATTPAKSTHYYVALKAKGPGCEVVSMKPSGKLMVGKHSFKTESDASKALASDKACKA